MGRKREITERKPHDHPQAEHTFYEFDDIFNVIETNSLWNSTSFVTVNSGINAIHFDMLFKFLSALFPISFIHINASSQTAAIMSNNMFLNFCPSLALFLHLLVDLIYLLVDLV